MPLLSINLSFDEIEAFVKDFFLKKNYKSIEITSKILLLKPFILSEFELMQLSENSVKSSETKTLMFDAVKNEFNDSFAINEILEAKKSFELPEIQFQVLKPKYNFNTFKRLVLIKASAFFNVARENIILLKQEMFYVPFWLVNVSFEKNQKQLLIDAFNKKVINPEIIESKEKSFEELFTETFADLTKPKKWAEYSSETAKLLFGSKKKSTIKAILFNQTIQIIILIIILLILLYILFFSAL